MSQNQHQGRCAQCGTDFPRRTRGRPAKYCSDSCRGAAAAKRSDRPQLKPEKCEDLTLAGDLLRGLGDIAAFIYGDRNKTTRRRVQYEAERGYYRTFHIGGMVHARKSELLEDFSAQRGRAA
jgi:hypothetical protein